MKKYISSALALGLASILAMAQNYKVVVTTTDDQKHEFETTSVDKIRFEEQPVYTDIQTVVGAEYRTYNGMGCYGITLSNGTPDMTGAIIDIGDYQISFELNGPVPEEYDEILIPTGYYQAGNGSKEYTWDITKSGFRIRLAEGDEGIATNAVTGGTVDVRRNGLNYDIRAEVNLISGENINIRYQGEIDFSFSETESLPIDYDMDINFEGAQGRFYANWSFPFADDITFQMYTGDFDRDEQLNGYWLNLSLYMPKVENPMLPNQRLQDGVYTVEKREDVENYTYVPYTFQRGADLDFWGVIYPSGSYITFKDSNKRMRMAYLTDGTLTISGNGSKIILDLVTREGYKLKGEYSGKINIKNFCDNDVKEPEIPCTLKGDYLLDFPPTAMCLSYYLSDYIIEGINNYIVIMGDLPGMKKGDYLSLELMCDADRLADGTYTINNSLENFSGIKGCVDPGGNLIYSWFGDLDTTDPETGIQEILAPISGGTVTITTFTDGKRHMEFNFIDLKGKKITGEYEGDIIDTRDLNIPQDIVKKLKAQKK